MITLAKHLANIKLTRQFRVQALFWYMLSFPNLRHFNGKRHGMCPAVYQLPFVR